MSREHTTVVHRRAQEIAEHRGLSLSAELTTRGLAQLDEPAVTTTDTGSGFPVVGVGRSVPSDEVATALDEE